MALVFAIFLIAMVVPLWIADAIAVGERRRADANERAWVHTATATELAAHLLPALDVPPRDAWTDRELHDALHAASLRVSARDYYESNWPVVLDELVRRVGR